MTRRRLLTASAALVLLAIPLYALFGRGPGRFRGATGDANVLLITIDTLRADHLGAYGYRPIKTPTIDALAGEGVLFENAVTPAVMTLPSHATILTGLYPPTHGIRDNGDYRLNSEVLTLAEVLKSRGLRTGAVVGSFVLDSMFNLGQGFETYDDALPGNQLNEAFLAQRPARAVTDAALRFLDGAKDARFFLWVHYYDPHHPYTAPSPFREQYARRGYDAEIAYVDAEIGRLLAALTDRGLKSRTLIVLTADHGEGLNDHGEQSHGIFLYEEEIRVPLVVSLPPHVPSGVRVRQTVRTVDIMPTILELIRIDPLEAAHAVQGRSLWPLMADPDPAQPGEPAYSEAMAPLLQYGWSPIFSIRDERWKYVEAPRPELYDLAADAKEKNNLALLRPELAAQYKQRLEKLRQDVTRPGTEAEDITLDPEAQARLRSLGYTAGGGAKGSAGPGGHPDPKDMVPMLARINSVYISFGSGQHEAAVREARGILAEDPSNSSVRYYMAGALTQLARYPEALEEYRKLLNRSPKDTAVMSNMGWCLLNMERFDEAAAQFRRVLEIYPEHIHALASLGSIAFIKGEFGEATSLYKQVLRLEPNYMLAIKALAGIAEGAGNLDDAVVLYAHGTEVDPDNPDLWMDLGWVRFRQGKHEEALQALEHARRIAPQAAQISLAIGDVQTAAGRLDEAQASYMRGLQADPRAAPGYYGLGLIELRRGDPAKAIELLKRALTLAPDKLAWREDLAHALARSGQYAAAAAELRQYLASGQVPPEKRDALQQQIEEYRKEGE
jgi:arylsulfatase A-like enzyme/Tfp pilus assembly protein PilF